MTAWTRHTKRGRVFVTASVLAGSFLSFTFAGGLAPAFAQSGSRICASSYVAKEGGSGQNVTYVRLVEVSKDSSWASWAVGYGLCNEIRTDGSSYPGWTKSASYERETCEDFSANVIAWDTLDISIERPYDYDPRDVCLSMERSALWTAKVVTDPATMTKHLVSWTQDWPPPPPPASS